MSEALTPLLVVFDELDYVARQWEGTSLGNIFCISGLICKPLFCSLPSSVFIFYFRRGIYLRPVLAVSV